MYDSISMWITPVITIVHRAARPCWKGALLLHAFCTFLHRSCFLFTALVSGRAPDSSSLLNVIEFRVCSPYRISWLPRWQVDFHFHCSSGCIFFPLASRLIVSFLERHENVVKGQCVRVNLVGFSFVLSELLIYWLDFVRRVFFYLFKSFGVFFLFVLESNRIEFIFCFRKLV